MRTSGGSPCFRDLHPFLSSTLVQIVNGVSFEQFDSKPQNFVAPRLNKIKT